MAQHEQLLRWFLGFQAFVQSREEFRPLAGAVTAPPDTVMHPEAFRLIHVRGAVHTIYSPQSEDMAVRAVDAYIREAFGVTNPIANVPAQALAHVAEMQDQGYSILPNLDSAKLAAMADHFRSRPVYEQSSNASGPALSLTEAESKLNIGHFGEQDVVNCPHLLELATDPFHLGIAQQFLGTVPQVITCAAWWSFAQADQARDAQLFHLDLDDYRFFKLFFYLTDVDEEAGPHVYVPTTHRADTLIRARQAASSPEAFDGWLGTLRKSDEDVKAAFGIEPVHLTGKAGTSFIACTRGIHKGLLPKSRNRLICQIAYGITPQRVSENLPVTLSPETTPNLPAGLLEPPLDYVLNLYLRPPPQA
ncbi:hypothetical protein [Hwanghaeella sp.]|uniref:hypothetical protein n=1 Tax=Hwanghaeella sp. TaxID=2605943 RepID=UPI003CCC2904